MNLDLAKLKQECEALEIKRNIIDEKEQLEAVWRINGKEYKLDGTVRNFTIEDGIEYIEK